MKKVFLNLTTLKKITRNVSFASLLSIAAMTSSHAQKINDTTATTAAVIYQGYANEEYYFLMKYDNETGEKFSIIITDSEGNKLYSETFADKKFSKIFKTHLETGSLTFVISNPKKKEEKKFKVNAERHIAEEFSVTKVN